MVCPTPAETVTQIWMKLTSLLWDGNEGVAVLCRFPARPPWRAKVSWSSPRASGAPTTTAASSPQPMTRPYGAGTSAPWGEKCFVGLVGKYNIFGIFKSEMFLKSWYWYFKWSLFKVEMIYFCIYFTKTSPHNSLYWYFVNVIQHMSL